MDDKKFYVAKRGVVTGPLSQEEFDGLKMSGKIDDYTYYWDSKAKEWCPLEAPPPPLGGEGKPASQRTPSWAGGGGIEAVCHNFSTIVTGLIENVSDLGCDLIAKDHSDMPRMGQSSQLVVNVVDSKKNRSVSVKAFLSDVTRRDGSWIYHIRWISPPAF